MVVKCPNVIPKDMQDKELLEKMFAEREGIIYKAVKALQTVIVNGYCFSEPESVIKTREKYMIENNTIISFFNECMCPWPDGKINDYSLTTGCIYNIYKKWCTDNNNGYAKTAAEFRDELCRLNGATFESMTKRVKGHKYYIDFTVTTEAKQLYATGSK